MTANAPPAATDDGQERAVLFAAVLGSSTAFIMTSALSSALPTIQTALNATASEFFWLGSIYNLMLASLILVGGALGDLYGRKRIFGSGIVILIGGLVAAGLAPTAPVLIAASAVQGLGGALMVPGSLAMITALVPAERSGSAIGTWSTFTTLTSILGPVVGGFLATPELWRLIYLMVIPLGLAALWFLRQVPENRGENDAPLDVPGAILATAGLAGVTYALIQGPTQGFGTPVILAALTVGVIGLVSFVLYERQAAHPLVDFRLFRSRSLVGANLLTIFLYGALYAALFFIPPNLNRAQGYDASLVGLAMIPSSLVLVVLSSFMGARVWSIGPRPLLTAGPLLVAGAFFLFSRIGMTNGPTDYWTTFFPAILLFGIGMGITVAPLTTTAMNSAPARSSGAASGINNAVSRAAGVLAVAAFAALAQTQFTRGFDTKLRDILPDDQRTAIVASEGPKLAAAEAPDSLPADQAEAVQAAARTAFVDVFSTILLICAGMAVLAALSGFLLIESSETIKRQHEGKG